MYLVDIGTKANDDKHNVADCSVSWKFVSNIKHSLSSFKIILFCYFINKMY